MHIPNLKDIKLGQFTLVDTENLRGETRREVLRTGLRFLSDLIDKTTKISTLCDHSQFNSERSKAWIKLATEKPGANWAEFRDSFEPGFDLGCQFDPRLNHKQLAVYVGKPEDGELAGVFYLYSMKVLDVKGNVIEAEAYPAPAFSVGDDVNWTDTATVIMRRLLGGSLGLEDIELHEGKTLRIMAMNFPSGANAWSTPWTDSFINGFESAGFQKDVSPNGVVKKFTRQSSGGE